MCSPSNSRESPGGGVRLSFKTILFYCCVLHIVPTIAARSILYRLLCLDALPSSKSNRCLHTKSVKRGRTVHEIRCVFDIRMPSNFPVRRVDDISTSPPTAIFICPDKGAVRGPSSALGFVAHARSIIILRCAAVVSFVYMLRFLRKKIVVTQSNWTTTLIKKKKYINIGTPYAYIHNKKM